MLNQSNNNFNNNIDLYKEWIKIKEIEQEVIQRRREIEDSLIEEMRVNLNEEGTQNFENEEYKVKVVTRFNRKIDADSLQELAIGEGLQDYLKTLFRWKPDLNMTAWKATDKSITDILSRAITTTPGRASFTITTKQTKGD